MHGKAVFETLLVQGEFDRMSGALSSLTFDRCFQFDRFAQCIYANVLHLDGLKNSIWVHHSVGSHLLLWGAMPF